MNGEKYIAYQCLECGMVFTIEEDGLRRADILKRVIRCNLGCRRIKKIGVYDNLKECMEQTYSRLI
ncbi:MAG: hypothetical protein RBR71_03565 [Gudongella sp.]|nr:hypothetical protein [Gudongella sp.]